jgi:ATP-dependent Lon protease
MRALLTHLDREVEILSIQESIERQTRDELDRRHKEFYLRQQMEAIQSELGEGETEGGAAAYLRRLEGIPIPPEVAAVLQKEIARLSRFSPFSEEQNQVRAFLDLVLDLPWGRTTEDRMDLVQAKRDLDRDHYGLKKIKERIIEHLAVAKLRGGRGGTLFCLVGPPGVGKTSLGRAVARTLGRAFVRMSLGGVRDESEIRGHRKTYIGAMPGRIIQGIRNAGSINPVFLLDEVDKMGSDWRGDPSSALLEALDGEQNREFVDHYLGFPFDLSQVMFIATANTLDGIHPALLDRMELLELPGYSEEEKVTIALKYILPREIEAHGLGQAPVEFPEPALMSLIRRYTREAGVRGLERGVRSVLRRIARKVAGGEPGPFKVTPGTMHHMVGHAPLFGEERPKADRVGVAAGLAWTEMGGEMLYVEATATQGQGALTLTGQMGEVMRESAQAALTYLKEHMREWRLTPKDFAKKDIHIHVPEGSIPKDGPSAGVTMAVAMLSTLTGRSVSHTTAFSGEITLRGEILPVGGLREKLLAAERARVRKVILPTANRPERRDLPRSVLKNLELVWVRTMDEVFPHALGPAAGRGTGERKARRGGGDAVTRGRKRAGETVKRGSGDKG